MLSDEILIAQCLKGKEKAQKALYDKYCATMLGICYRYAGTSIEAEDILQDAFIQVFSLLHQFRKEGSLEGWIKKVTISTALNYMKRNKEFIESLSIEAINYEVPLQPEEASIKLNGKDLMDCIQSLPGNFKAIVNLFAIEGFSHREIAGMLDITEKTSRLQYTQAKAMLAMRILENNKILVPVPKAG